MWNVKGEIETMIDEIVEKYQGKRNGMTMSYRHDENNENIELINEVQELMDSLDVEYKIEQALFAKARFYAVAYIEFDKYDKQNKLQLVKIEADAY